MVYYEVLGLDPNASKDEIKKSWRNLALRHHPDRNSASDAEEKFREITDAYEFLYNFNQENIQSDFADTVEPGKVRISHHEYPHVTIKYGEETEFGTLRASQNNKFYVFFSRGYLSTLETSSKWINGKIILIRDDCLIWMRDFERPINAVVSDNGMVVVLYSNHREVLSSSSPKEFIDLGGTLSVIDKSGELKFTYEFGSNIEGCTISPDGKLALVGTLYPNNSVYCFDISKQELLWKYQNHIKRLTILELRFNGSHVDIFMGKSLATINKEYELNLDGTLTNEYQQKLDSLNKLKKGHPQEKAEYFLAMAASSDKRVVEEGFSKLAAFVITKGALPYYEQIVNTLGNLLKLDSDLFDMIWKVVRKILKRKPEAGSIIVPIIVSQLKIHTQNDAQRILPILSELGSNNPMWISDDIEFIKQKMRSRSWNERRFAILAVGSIGSADPVLVKNEIPFLIEYASDPEKMTKEIEQSGQVSNPPVLSDFNTSFLKIAFYSTGYEDKDVWLRDACLDAIGTIGKRHPESVKAAIPLLKKLSKVSSSPHTIKKATLALDVITKIHPP